jgi:hypothetical protein
VIFDRRIRLAYTVIVLTLIVGGLGLGATVNYLGYHLQKTPVPLRKDLSTIPLTIGDWKRYGEDAVEKEDVLQELGTKFYLTRTYARNGIPRDGAIQLHLAYYTGMIDAVPHIPERCMYAAGLLPLQEPTVVALDVKFEPDGLGGGPVNVATGLPYAFSMVEDPVTRKITRVAMPVEEVALTLTRFQNPKDSRIEVDVGYFFIANGRVTPTGDGVRRLAFNLSDEYAYFCKVQLGVTYPFGDQDVVELFRKDVSDFIRQLMPHLMRALPDWPALEAQEAAKRTTK